MSIGARTSPGACRIARAIPTTITTLIWPIPCVLLAQFGSSGPALVGDQSHNGIVDLEDLAVLLDNFGQACP